MWDRVPGKSRVHRDSSEVAKAKVQAPAQKRGVHVCRAPESYRHMGRHHIIHRAGQGRAEESTGSRRVNPQTDFHVCRHWFSLIDFLLITSRSSLLCQRCKPSTGCGSPTLGFRVHYFSTSVRVHSLLSWAYSSTGFLRKDS